MREIFAMDVGNLGTKLKSSRGEYVLDSSFVSKSQLGMTSELGIVDSKEDLFTFESNKYQKGTKFLWGRDLFKSRAIRNASRATISLEQRYNSEDFLLLTELSLGYLAKDFIEKGSENRVIDILLIIGLPTSDYLQDGYKKSLPDKLKGTHKITIDDEEYFINVKNILITVQTLGTIYNLTFSDEGKLSTREYITSDGIVVDFGGGTRLLDRYENGKLTSERTQLGGGASDFYDAVAKNIIQHENIHISPIDVQRIIREGNDTEGYFFLPNKNKSIDVTKYVLDQKDVVTEDMINKITSTFKVLVSLDFIIFTGGGSHLLNHEIIRNRFEEYGTDIILPDSDEDIELSNVRGYYKYATIVEQQSKK